MRAHVMTVTTVEQFPGPMQVLQEQAKAIQVNKS